mmetsp:Transcript_7924/g.14791  ORF Transcript_7924/g.14791 Transcript_7924/m.14791 type:complete len:270 (+) Transcript_7924:2214-3023(+)
MAEQVANHGGNAGDTIDVLITTSTRTTYFNVGLILLSLAMFILAAYLVQVLYSGGVVRVKRAVTLLIGPANSGKTTLFRKMKYGKTPGGTVTSVIPNEEECKVGEDTYRVVDYPGHVKLRSGAEPFLNRALKIVFVADSLVFNQNEKVREAANFLFGILSNRLVLKDRVPIFIACNKADRMNAFSPEFIKKRLEKEIDILLSTVGDLSDTKGSEDELVSITTRPGEPFKFADCLSNVTWGAISGNKGNLKALHAYLSSSSTATTSTTTS